MDTIEALEFKYGLNKFLRKYMNNHRCITVWDCYFADSITYEKFSSFLRTKTGQKWLKSDLGKGYLKWQGE